MHRISSRSEFGLSKTFHNLYFFSEEEIRRKSRAFNLMGCENMKVQTDNLMRNRVVRVLVLVNNEYDFFLIEVCLEQVLPE